MPNENKNIIAIDGPAGAGKGTLTKKLCEHYKFAGLDTGSLYRAITLCLIKMGTDMDKLDEQFATDVAERLSDTHEILTYAKNPEIRSQLTNKYVASVAKIPELRKIMRKYQTNFAINPPPLEDGTPAKGAIIEGRDIGTVICPDAPVKFFMTANAETRASRRLKQYLDQGETANYQEVLESIIARDEADRTRETSPMKQADDAIVIDTSINDKEQTFEMAKKIIKEKLNLE
ncbi:MAG: (d)CMP kinase [Alphaproteobacteria bacterium]|nr:(d)CMP kinase [Alphaproteobacteria bacterium]